MSWQPGIPSTIPGIKTRVRSFFGSNFLAKPEDVENLQKLSIWVKANKIPLKGLKEKGETITINGMKYPADLYFQAHKKPALKKKLLASGEPSNDVPQKPVLYEKVIKLIYVKQHKKKMKINENFQQAIAAAAEDNTAVFDQNYDALVAFISTKLPDEDQEEIKEAVNYIIFEEQAERIVSTAVNAANGTPVGVPIDDKPTTLQTTVLSYFTNVYNEFTWGCKEYDRWASLAPKMTDVGDFNFILNYLKMVDKFILAMGLLLADALIKNEHNKNLNLNIGIPPEDACWASMKNDLFQYLYKNPIQTGLNDKIVAEMNEKLTRELGKLRDDRQDYQQLTDEFYTTNEDNDVDNDRLQIVQNQPRAIDVLDPSKKAIQEQAKAAEKLAAQLKEAEIKRKEIEAKLVEAQKKEKEDAFIQEMHEIAGGGSNLDEKKGIFNRIITHSDKSKRIKDEAAKILAALNKKESEGKKQEALKKAKEEAEQKAAETVERAAKLETLTREQQNRLASLQVKKNAVDEKLDEQTKAQQALAKELEDIRVKGAATPAARDENATQINAMMMPVINEGTKNTDELFKTFTLVKFLCLFLGSSNDYSYAAFKKFAINDMTFDKFYTELEHSSQEGYSGDSDVLTRGLQILKSNSALVVQHVQQWNAESPENDLSISSLAIELASFLVDYLDQTVIFVPVDKDDIDPIPKSGDDSVLKHNPFVEGLRSDRAGVPMSEISQRLLKILGQ